MKQKISSSILLFAIIAALIPAAFPAYDASAQEGYITVDLQPNATQGIDTQIVSSASSTNYGTSAELGVGESNAATSIRRSLITFDLTGLPYDLDVIYAALTLTVDQDLSNNARTLYAYPIHAVWGETTASWNSRGGANWQTAGASGANDAGNTPIGSVSVTDTLTAGSTVTIILDEEFIANLRLGNYTGIKLQMDIEEDDLYIFRSSDYATETDRPKLSVTYDPDSIYTDPGWQCVDGLFGGIYNLHPCDTYAVRSPYNFTGNHTYTSNGGHRNVSGAKLNCEPYPKCANDHDVHYRLEWSLEWTAALSQSPTINFYFELPGRTDRVISTGGDCGSGLGGSCSGYFEGIIPAADMTTADDIITVGVRVETGGADASLRDKTYNWTLYLSTTPINQACSASWYVPLPEKFEIDPTLETPLGIEGEPPDHQIYPTIIGQTYMVRVEDGPWDDGINPNRTDAAVSFDGITWMTWGEFSTIAICIETIPETAANLDYRVLYFTATTETFYIRVNDIAEAFADNLNDLVAPYSYVIGIAFSLAEPVACEAQFTYDEVYDSVATVNLLATSESTTANPPPLEPLTPGAWYAIEVVSGTWSETGGEGRTDIQYRFPTTDWMVLDEESDLVFCVSSDGSTAYIQAPNGENVLLYLRVNDQDVPVNFADNTGSLGINIIAATFNRIISGCELQFEMGSFVYHDTVQGNATNGKVFANSFASQDAQISFSYGLQPGGWYVLETTDGPWFQTFTGGGYTAHTQYYDMQIRTGTSGEWTSLSEWSLAECVVEIDALGHERMYFQVPTEGGGQYSLKVAGAGPFTRGFMGWDLYQAVDIGLNGIDDCQDFVFNQEAPLMIGQVNSWLEVGNYINGLSNDAYFAIQIESADSGSGWYEYSGGDESDELQLTIDGANWQTLPNHPAVLCHYYTPGEDELVYFIRVTNGQQWRMRADSTSFNNNVGSVNYTVYGANAGALDSWNTCMSDYTASVPALNEHEWIPPQDVEGVMLMPTLTYTPNNDPDQNGIINWGSPGLAPDNTYMVTISNGPWYDGSSPVGKYTAQLSSDGGSTWYSFKDHPSVICSTLEQTKRYWKAIFDVDAGQVWKIRVADTETSVFTDNTGNLAYKLNLVNAFPINGPGDYAYDYDPGAFDVCSQALVRPGALSLSEIGSVGNYLGDWVHYINRSMLSYFAWCPQHTDMILGAIRALETREPLATIATLQTVSKTVAADVNSYDWEGGYDDTSIFNVSSQGGVNAIVEKVLPTAGVGTSPWEEGGNLVNFNSGNNGLPSYYYTCDSVFADYLPSRARIGVCFASAYWKQTGASFWLQLSLDLGAIFLLFRMIKGAAQSLVYMMTGVRPWTKDGAQKLIVDVASGSELIQPVDRWRSRR